MSSQKPDSAAILAGLKDFQRQTVNYVFDRLYGKDPAERFLIADEVGLGKTLVARGLIAKAIDHLWQEDDRRIDIVYICANRDIAAQNINRLNVTQHEDQAFASRLTLLPLQLKNLNQRLNFISFTPGTSFDLRSRAGIVSERALIYHILKSAWGFGNAAAPRNLLQCDCSSDRWDREIEEMDPAEINPQLAQAFLAILEKEGVRPRFDETLERFQRRREHNQNVPGEDRDKRNTLVGDMRRLLARACLKKLEPDIIILDEFQRFKNLLNGEDEVGQLAQELFTCPDAKVLLLSATPYKMYTMSHETETDEHYADFLRTLEFLFRSKSKTEAFEGDLEAYRKALFEPGPAGLQRLKSAKRGIEAHLRRCMVRTERLGVTVDRDGMVEEAGLDRCELQAEDVRSFLLVDRVARSLESHDSVEYWKSAPYLLNLMDATYDLKRKFSEAQKANVLKKEALQALESGKTSLLPWGAIQKYQSVDAGNAKLRLLVEETVGRNAWQLLWVPPSMPYYNAGGPMATPQLRTFTKALVFSSWKVVPKVIASLVSYEAERQVMATAEAGLVYPELSKQRRPLLQFNIREGELGGMNLFTLLYPCVTLAMRIDPLKIGASLSAGGQPPSYEQLFAAAREQVKNLLDPILAAFTDELVKKGLGAAQRADQAWYSAALVLLDRQSAREEIEQWRADSDQDRKWEAMLPSAPNEGESRFAEHVAAFWKLLEGKPLGVPPADLVDVITKVAIASPAVGSLRALARIASFKERRDVGGVLMASAARCAMGFRTLLNMPESITLIRGLRPGVDERYWEEALDYCASGNLQSVMDEYVHMLRESLGQKDKSVESAAWAIADEIHTAVSLRTISLEFEDIGINQGKVTVDRHRLRSRFALPYGDGKGEENEGETRADQVRSSFNSPFRPFVLASTSVGQEGLDFHPYCHSIYHWNLPSNPVDLEQREGRVHRYKGLVVRRNVAADSSLEAIKGELKELSDPWEILFDFAKKTRKPHHNDLIPYWIFEGANALKIRRFVPLLPLSKDLEQLERLKETLAVYRMVFGMSRQEDLAAYLCSRLGQGVNLRELMGHRIDLSPESSRQG